MKYKIDLDYCIKLIKSDEPIDKIRRKLYFLFSFEYNFFTFCKFFLPNTFYKEFGKFHKEIIDEFWSNESNSLACPRGHGKSSLIGQGFVLHRIVYKLEKYILYCSVNTEKSNQFLEPIKFELKNNQRLKLVYPNIDLKKVKDEESGRDRQDCFDIGHDMRIQAFSFEKNVRGFKFHNQRPTLMVFDDIDDDQIVINPTLRQKDYYKLSKIMIPALDAEKGKYKMIGTIIHLDSCLARSIKGDNGKIYRAFEYDDNKNIIEDSILFPEMFTKKYFEDYIKRWGWLSCSSEFLNNPVDDVSSLIKRKWVKSCFCEELSLFETPEKYDLKVMGVDFAFSDRIVADKSEFIGIGFKNDCYDIMSVFSKKGMSIIEQFDYITYLNGVFGFDDISMEENSIRSMSKELLNYNFKYTLFWTSANDSVKKEKDYLDMEYEGKRHTIGKTSMIKRLATIFENNYNSIQQDGVYKFRIPYKTDRDKEIAHSIMDECCSFALDDGKLIETGVHPDKPIAISLCFERFGLGDLGYEVGLVI
jgi:hypothetical protein